MATDKSTERVGSCKARVEFLACKAEILELLEAGNSVAFIHRSLFSDGKITMKYKTLTTYVKKTLPATKKEQKPTRQESVNKQNLPKVQEEKSVSVAISSEDKDAVPFGKKDPSKPYNQNI